jgi:hypothetical protein
LSGCSELLPDRSAAPLSNAEERLQSDFRAAQKFQLLRKTVDDPPLQIVHGSSITSDRTRADPATPFLLNSGNFAAPGQSHWSVRILGMIVESNVGGSLLRNHSSSAARISNENPNVFKKEKL